MAASFLSGSVTLSYLCVDCGSTASRLLSVAVSSGAVLCEVCDVKMELGRFISVDGEVDCLCGGCFWC